MRSFPPPSPLAHTHSSSLAACRMNFFLGVTSVKQKGLEYFSSMTTSVPATMRITPLGLSLPSLLK